MKVNLNQYIKCSVYAQLNFSSFQLLLKHSPTSGYRYPFHDDSGHQSDRLWWTPVLSIWTHGYALKLMHGPVASLWRKAHLGGRKSEITVKMSQGNAFNKEINRQQMRLSGRSLFLLSLLIGNLILLWWFKCVLCQSEREDNINPICVDLIPLTTSHGYLCIRST